MAGTLWVEDSFVEALDIDEMMEEVFQMVSRITRPDHRGSSCPDTFGTMRSICNWKKIPDSTDCEYERKRCRIFEGPARWAYRGHGSPERSIMTWASDLLSSPWAWNSSSNPTSKCLTTGSPRRSGSSMPPRVGCRRSNEWPLRFRGQDPQGLEGDEFPAAQAQGEIVKRYETLGGEILQTDKAEFAAAMREHFSKGAAAVSAGDEISRRTVHRRARVDHGGMGKEDRQRLPGRGLRLRSRFRRPEASGSGPVSFNKTPDCWLWE